MRRSKRKLFSITAVIFLLIAFTLCCLASPAHSETPADSALAAAASSAPRLTADSYPTVSLPFAGKLNGRLVIWITAQLHLYFAAFVLGVPVFVLIIEMVGVLMRDPRYDILARELMTISLTAFSFTATFGGILLFSLIIFYPDFTKYSLNIFRPVMMAYAVLFLAESAFLYVYYYGWDAMARGNLKWIHLTFGLLLNVAGTSLMVLANSWSTFMMAPTGVSAEGVFLGNIWDVIHGPLWNPLNLHRFVANVAYGGSIVGAYAGYKFLTSESFSERAHYDWMGHKANMIAIIGLIPLPFAGYWMTKEIYAYSQQLGITLMGGIFAWLFIIQALLIGALFLGANYYLWMGMGRFGEGNQYRRAVKYLSLVLTVCFLIWFTPHTLMMTGSEIKALGGPHHPVLGYLGVMSAKNTAVNIMIVTTFLSFLLYRRTGRKPVVPWAWAANCVLVTLFLAGAGNIIFLGVYGYFVPAAVRIGFSIPQVVTTLSVIVIGSVINEMMYRGSQIVGAPNWGRMPVRSQYALFVLAVSFTWLMGLMGYVRSGIRQHWHIYTIMRDYSSEAYTPTLGYAAMIITGITLIFLAMVIFIFWLDDLRKKKGDGQKI